MTLSISALCPESGQLGIAIASSSIAVGALPLAACWGGRGGESEYYSTFTRRTDPGRVGIWVISRASDEAGSRRGSF